MIKIKNCGLSTPETLQAALRAGASFIGFVHHAASPRHLDAASMATLANQVPSHVARVAVLVNPSDATLAYLPKPNFWQLHEVNDPARIHAIAQQTGIPVISAIRVRSTADVRQASTLEEVSDHLLFDAYHASQIGGAGVTFDWGLLTAINLKKPWFLAGGLTSSNVQEAIAISRAPMVDVSSGIETSPGIKSKEKIIDFNTAVIGCQ
jgi:phosphoribosylanthranilate isomerase